MAGTIVCFIINFIVGFFLISGTFLFIAHVGTGGQSLIQTRLSLQYPLDIWIVCRLLKLSTIHPMSEGINYSDGLISCVF